MIIFVAVSEFVTNTDFSVSTHSIPVFRFQVTLQTALLNERLPTDLTFEPPVILVYPHVLA